MSEEDSTLLKQLQVNEKFIDYKVKQKSWWRNMDNIVINYHHMGEENHMYLVHMITPKIRIDRVCAVKGCRWFNG